MSDLSLLTSIYANVEHFASLIDTVIEHARTSATPTPGDAQKRLGQLLVDAGDQGQASQSYEALMLDSLLRDPSGETPLDLPQLGSRLLGGAISSSDQKQLEILAQGLERERSAVAGRLRGRG
ncbi:hypothetical protein SAMN02745126_06486 [Enhydrobacter aerosaccus]|uniref:Uncharacterized protein n=1 Tax=Enhydrobacter aerosaccus TaxID=225324 RepID=A0A1T4TLD0_9HYPH|nr:hypothetical protein [Enhydrobacter aerosaccus]SKA41323.1 hypothetical protein SAMN02745126_06486 [Enhydrobacter aerosaccus]